MEIEKIKNALKARAQSLNLNSPAPVAPIVADVPVTPQPPVVTENPLVKNADKNPALQIPLLNPAQIQPETKGDKVAPPVNGVIVPSAEEAAKPAVGKPARKAVARKPKEAPAPVVSAPVPVVSAPAIPQVSDIEAIIAKHLKAGRDYDRLPNTSKPTLLKSGAEILAGVFVFRTTAKVINRVENYDKQFVLYEVCVSVLDKDGNTVAEGLGSCNSRERRYLKTDFATNLNTILKMAKKRAFIDAILTATHASRVFTQDIEDIASLQIASDNKQLK